MYMLSSSGGGATPFAHFHPKNREMGMGMNGHEWAFGFFGFPELASNAIQAAL